MMRRTINLLLMLLFVAEVTSANTVDFDKAFKESARIEKQIKRTSFPKRTFLITDFGAKTDDEANPCHEAINQADRKSTRLNSSHTQKSRMPSSA